jgi:hypothetical protein
MKTILSHLSNNSKNYIGVLKALAESSNQIKSVIIPLHGRIFDTVEEVSPDYVLLSLSEYTQEFHDFISNTNSNVLLFIDEIPQGNPDEVIKFLSQKNNIKFISNISLENFNAKNTIRYYKLYNSDIFYHDETMTKTNKVAVLLSVDNDKNEKIQDILYPNKTTNPIVCFNNPNFNHITNLGILTEIDLQVILNTYYAIMDLDNQFELESIACQCNRYDLSTLNKDLSKMSFIDQQVDLSAHTFKHFVTNVLLPELGA